MYIGGEIYKVMFFFYFRQDVVIHGNGYISDSIELFRCLFLVNLLGFFFLFHFACS